MKYLVCLWWLKKRRGEEHRHRLNDLLVAGIAAGLGFASAEQLARQFKGTDMVILAMRCVMTVPMHVGTAAITAVRMWQKLSEAQGAASTTREAAWSGVVLPGVVFHGLFNWSVKAFQLGRGGVTRLGLLSAGAVLIAELAFLWQQLVTARALQQREDMEEHSVQGEICQETVVLVGGGGGGAG